MPAYFLDTSAVVKRYVQESGTLWLQNLTMPSSSLSLFVSRLAWVETIAAITRRERAGHITPSDVGVALGDFSYDFANQYRIVEVSPGLVTQAASLARTHGLRGYDAVQLAAALQFRSQVNLTLISADVDLNTAAVAVGLAVDDPNAHP